MKFAEMAAQFETHKHDLELAIQMYTGITVTSANITVTSAEEKLTAMTAKIDVMFDNMQSLEEKELAEFARKNGGTEGLLENSELKEKLFEKEKKRAENEIGPSAMPTTFAEFEQELAKDEKTILEENKKAFERRFSEFNLLQQDSIRRESDRVIQAVLVGTHAGSHEQILDKVLPIACLGDYAYADSSSIQDLSYIWKEMVRMLNILIDIY